ncbi:hypothetical protein [Candidatus Nitrosotenuis sp. DW1]|uniref:hypothetical protein n=1 Tax=Candidatus Nitrosotenuis sp. DW1 TaxID=2259672 RepID=UPI0015CA2B0B|nr:hypothetical protein [Candidatus Nitrosotenuis sp. DW1]QLH09722.1 hypothetical protein DSQ19_09820 [Candidatus Nitrosotenuis sp. DW1]
MNKKIRVAFVYKSSNPYMSKKAWATTYYHFFMDALKRNPELDVSYFPAETNFDTSILKNNFDVILLWENHPWGTPDELIGIKNLNIPVICRINDAHDAKIKGKIAYHEKYKIDYYFGYLPSSFFYKYYPKNFKYKVIIYGVEPSLYENLTPFSQRIKNKILCSGAAASTKFHTQLFERIVRFRGETSMYKHYKLRTMCIKLPYVDYTTTLSHKYVNDDYPKLLAQYRASIASHSLYPVIKYWENTASNCLTFMEVTEKNRADILGFKDNETAIFINEKNYKQKFQEYLEDPNNPKWEQIANAGREYTMANLTNDKAVESLVELMKELIK